MNAISTFVALSVVASTASADLFVVDPTPELDPTTGLPLCNTYLWPQEAIDAAYATNEDGHIIVIPDFDFALAATSGTIAGPPKPGIRLHRPDLSIVIASTGPNRPQVSHLEIPDLNPAEYVVVRGLEVEGPSFATGNEGRVWLEDCHFRDGVGFVPSSAGPAPTMLTLSGGVGTGSVVMTRCSVDGINGRDIGLLSPLIVSSGVGMQISNQEVAIYDSSIEGGTGADSALVGADAVQVDLGCRILTSGSIVAGGAGAPGDPSVPCSNGSDGGNGIVLIDSASEYYDLGSSLVGGEGGDGVGSCSDGVDGVGLVDPGAVAVDLGSPGHSLEVTSPGIADGTQNVTIHAQGLSNEVFVLYYGGTTRFEFLAGTNGAVGAAVVENPGHIVSQTDGNGEYSLSIAPTLNGGAPATVVYLQAVFADTVNAVAPAPYLANAGAPSALIVLNPGYACPL